MHPDPCLSSILPHLSSRVLSQQFADTNSFRSRFDSHYLVRALPRAWCTGASCIFYAAVYANDKYITTAANYSIGVRFETPGKTICPGYNSSGFFSCGGNLRGSCLFPTNSQFAFPDASVLSGAPDPYCVCTPNYGGEICQGLVLPLNGGSAAQGYASTSVVVQPGDIVYFKANLQGQSGQSLVNTADLSMQHSGGQSVVMVRSTLQGETTGCSGGIGGLCPTAWPTPLSGPSSSSIFPFYIFSPAPTDTANSWVMSPNDGNGGLQGGINVVAVFNMDYYLRSPLNFTLQLIEQPVGAGQQLVKSSFMTIILGIILSMFLCLIMSVCKRYGARWFFRRRRLGGWDMDSVFIGPNGMPVGGLRPPVRGIDPAVVQSFPTVAYSEGLMPKEDSQCAVCLGDYEEGEGVRKLPPCSHYFHVSCIDTWLVAHTTCPLCRTSLVPDSSEPGGPGGGGVRGTGSLLPGAVLPAAGELEMGDLRPFPDANVGAQRSSLDRSDRSGEAPPPLVGEAPLPGSPEPSAVRQHVPPGASWSGSRHRADVLPGERRGSRATLRTVGREGLSDDRATDSTDSSSGEQGAPVSPSPEPWGDTRETREGAVLSGGVFPSS